MANKKINFQHFKSFWFNKKIFITGHTGFKGSWLIILLNLLGAKIIGYSLAPKKNSLFNRAKLKKLMFKNYYNDVTDEKKLLNAIKNSKAKIVIHLAAQPIVSESFFYPVKTFNTNVLGTLNILNCIKKIKNIKSTLIITTDKVYKSKNKKTYSENDELGADDPYGSSKVCAEYVTNSYIKSFFLKSGQKVSTVRSGNVIGSGDISKNRLIPDIIRSIQNKKKLYVRNPRSIRPWQHVIEPNLGYLLLAQLQHKSKKNMPQSWNFGPKNKNFKTVLQIIKKFNKVYNLKYAFLKKKIFSETKILKIKSLKAEKYLNWYSRWNLDQTINQIIKWEMNVSNGADVRKECENQIFNYLNN